MEGPALSGESPALSSYVILAQALVDDAADHVAMAFAQTVPSLFCHFETPLYFKRVAKNVS